MGARPDTGGPVSKGSSPADFGLLLLFVVTGHHAQTQDHHSKMGACQPQGDQRLKMDAGTTKTINSDPFKVNTRITL